MSQVIRCDGCNKIMTNYGQPFYHIDFMREQSNIIPSPPNVHRSVPLQKLPVVKGDFCGLPCITIKFAKAQADHDSLHRSSGDNNG